MKLEQLTIHENYFNHLFGEEKKNSGQQDDLYYHEKENLIVPDTGFV